MPFYQRRCRSTVGVRSWRLAMTLKKEIRVVVCVRQTADLVQEQQPRRRSVKEALIKPSDSPVLSRVQGLRTHGNLLIPFKVRLSNQERNPLVQGFLNVFPPQALGTKKNGLPSWPACWSGAY